MSTTHVLLGLLARGERHGYDLKREHDTRFPQAKPLAFGQVYATLERLRRDGLVDVAGTERVDGPDRTTYRITEGGRTELATWLSTVEQPAPYVANVLFTKVVVALLASGGHPDRIAADFLREQREAHMTRMREYTRLKTDPDSTLADVLAADYALAHLDADLRWIETALHRIGALLEEVLS
jgi:DNA-binding PadR family transcriptional regulator